jgi:hemolysin III
MNSFELNDRLVYYSEAEELLNRYTHGFGALLSVIGVTALIVLASGQHDAYRVVSACIYGVSMITFYCLSTAYHSVRKPYVRYVFRILDHASIYLMIAGSYTPFALVTLRGPWGWTLLGTVWGLGALGAGMKVFTTHRLRFIGPLLYIALGWVVVIAFKPLSAGLALNGMYLLFSGGVAYTFGVVFYLWDRLPFNHAIWHLFVLAGSACHFFAIFYYVTPRPL